MNLKAVRFFNSVWRVWILYAFALAVIFLFLDHKTARFHSYGATLSRLQPSYEYLTKYNDGKAAYDRQELLAYRLFFSRLVSILPQRSDGYALLGYCQHELGDTQAAIASLKKSADAVPPFLWFNYNLGYMYFEVKDYSHAIEYLNKAVQGNSEIAFKYMKTSKLYLDAIATISGFPEQFPSRVRNGLRDSYKLLVLSYFYSKQSQEMVGAAQMAINLKLDDDGFFHYYLGIIAYYSGQLEASVMYFQKAIALDSQAADNYHFLALALKDLGRQDLAMAVMKQSQQYSQTKGSDYGQLKNIRLKFF
ncbi:MAG: hypothetical protein JNN05_04210 [Candidatus Omnitrophica bacterium]|nr:hypothetical protein [Candidatus Omnitrophota bacterium]